MSIYNYALYKFKEGGWGGGVGEIPPLAVSRKNPAYYTCTSTIIINACYCMQSFPFMCTCAIRTLGRYTYMPARVYLE